MPPEDNARPALRELVPTLGMAPADANPAPGGDPSGNNSRKNTVRTVLDY